MPQKLTMGVWQENWANIDSIDKETFDSIMGPEDWHWREDVTLGLAEEFAAKLDRPFESIGRS